MNRIEITGRLVKDIEEKRDRNGNPVRTRAGHIVAGSSIADQHSKKMGDVSYFNFVIYGEVAQVAMNSLKKGELVHIDGWIKQNRWKAQDGTNRNNYEIRVQEICPAFPSSTGGGRSTTSDRPSWVDDSEVLDVD